jgi:serine/threonine-protein kinase
LQTHEIYEFGPFRLDASARRLLREGKSVSLKPKVFDTLLALIRGRGSVVSKNQLLQIVWPDTVVEENNLAQNISVLRKAFGESPEEYEYIMTIPGQGYRFVAPVREIAPVASVEAAVPEKRVPVARSRPAIALLGLLFIGIAITVLSFRRGETPSNVATSPPRSIAVLPFRSLEGDDTDDYLELGIVDVLTTQLGRFKQIRVRPASPAQTYAKAGQDSVAAGRAMQVDSVLEVTIQKSGDQVSVTARLLDTQTEAILWANHFEGKSTNIFAIQEAIASQISTELQLEVTAAERERIYHRYTDNVEAYDSYLRGRSQLLQHRRQETLDAIQSFQKALGLDPDYALAHAGLATASATMALRFAPQPEIKAWQDKAQEEAALALKLAPDLAEAHEALAAVYGQTEFDWDKTLEEARLALKLNSNLDMPHYIRGRAFYHHGLFERADAESLTGLNVTAENRKQALRVQGVTALFASRFDNAVSILEESKRLEDDTVEWHLAMAYYYAGNPKLAENMLAGIKVGAQAPQRAAATLASILAARGEKERATALLRSVTDYGYKDHHVAYSIGAAHAQLGNVTEALFWLTRAKDSGFPCYPWFKQDSLLKPLHNEAGFKAFLSGFEKEWEQKKIQLEQL